MSGRDEEIIERLRRGYEAFNRGDYDSAMEMIAADPEIEFARSGGQPPITGAEALRGWMEPDAFEENIIEPLDFRMRGWCASTSAPEEPGAASRWQPAGGTCGR